VNSPKTSSTLLKLGKSNGQSLSHNQLSGLSDPAVVSPLQRSLDKKPLQLTGAEAGFISSHSYPENKENYFHESPAPSISGVSSTAVSFQI